MRDRLGWTGRALFWTPGFSAALRGIPREVGGHGRKHLRTRGSNNGADSRRLRALGVQFKKPVWPGETLRTVGYAVDDKIALETFAEDRPEAVVGGAWADIAPSGAPA